MANCKHINEMVPAVHNTGVASPDDSPWKCSICSVKHGLWLCLCCGRTHCGGQSKLHHLQHFESHKHSLAMEIDTLFLYCFPCQDFTDMDTVSGDVRLYRDIIPVITKQHQLGLGNRPPRRKTRSTGNTPANPDPVYSSVVKFRRACVLRRAFNAWKCVISKGKSSKLPVVLVKKLDSPSKRLSRKRKLEETTAIDTKYMDRSMLTGLGNVGNTCYMNAVLQILCNLDEFRDRLLELCPVHVTPGIRPGEVESLKIRKYISKRSLEYLPERNTFGGPITRSSSVPARAASVFADKSEETPCQMRLTEEVYALLGVMWSGKLSLVIPNGFMQAMWDAVPAFKGHHQHDAQEFLTEMLDKLSDDVTEPEPDIKGNAFGGLSGPVRDLVRDLFHGELKSQVTCLACQHKSITSELFSDLSLEFPERFQNCRLTNLNLAVDECHVSEMLAAFTRTESLGKVYQCDLCNQPNTFSDSTRSRCKSKEVSVKSEAEKRILISKLPKILRLHLKRFRWSGRSRREKISIHVSFDEILSVRGSCVGGGHSTTEYRLCGLVMHHGRGFHSGHYTAYCWNSKAKLWLHCNDARLEVVPLEHVLAAQAYILFYSRVKQEEDSQME